MKIDLKKQIKEVNDLDEQREKIISISRDVQRLSKAAIFAMHKGGASESEKLLEAASKELKKTQGIAKNHPRLAHQGILEACMQEFAEAACFCAFISGYDIPDHKELAVPADQYLMGIADMTGELVRKAVVLAISDEEKVSEIRDMVTSTYKQFLALKPRGELRKKSDSIKWNLQKIEDIMYDLALRKKK